MEKNKAPETNEMLTSHKHPEQEKNHALLNEPDISDHDYSCAGCLTRTIDEMAEVIKGRVFKMNMPGRIHQEILGFIFVELYQFLKGKPCKVYDAPFNVRLPVSSAHNEDLYTVVYPDICVVYDKAKLDDAGCVGAPDLIIEILSRGNNRKELRNKYEVYEESGVNEYWLIHPEEQTVLIYTLEKSRYRPSRLFTVGDAISSDVLPGFTLKLEDAFVHC